MSLPILQDALQQKILGDLGDTPWIEVHSSVKDNQRRLFLVGALVPKNLVSKVLQKPEWDFDPTRSLPGCIQYGYGGHSKKVQYCRFGRDDGIEPLVIERYFHGLKPEELEILEEFRLFYNLHYDRKNRKYVKITDAGDELDVVRMESAAVLIRNTELKQFLAIKEMFLAIYIDSRVRSDQPLSRLGLTPDSNHVALENINYTFYMADADFKGGAFSRLLGKKLIPGFAKEQCGIWPYTEKAEDEEEKQYTQFIVGVKDDGTEELAPCDPHGGRYLRPVFFKREVLSKYYSNPSKYSVEDGYLRCGHLWGIQIDNDRPDYVVVFLGDLGRDLPESEHLYWKSFNVPPAGGLSRVAFRRSIMAEFADPEQPDLLFKDRFEKFQTRWFDKFGWHLFRPLSEEDAHCYDALRIPLTTEQAEFDAQVQALTKLLIDSLNEGELSKSICTKESSLKGIAKFEKFLAARGAVDFETHISFLRILQDLRSTGVAHRKGDKYQKAAGDLGIPDKDLREVFADFLRKGTALLCYLESTLL